MDAKKVETILLHSRMAIIELMLMRLDVAVRALQPPHSKSAALRAALAEYEGFAQTLEKAAFDRPEWQLLSVEERALFADEYREMIDQMKDRLKSIFGSSN